MGSRAEDTAKLQHYSACDISDALLKLKVPGAGFVADLNLYSHPEGKPTSVTVAPVSTVLFAPKGHDLSEPLSNIPKGVHWADLTHPGTIVVVKQPDGQKNAVCGGIMALRMKVCQAKGIVVAGRARDIEELKSTSLSGPVGYPLWESVAEACPGRPRYLSTSTVPSCLPATWHLAIQSMGWWSFLKTRSLRCSNYYPS
ncbi:hypothetical protein ACJ41O_008582 [Fusarium nematophilum]